MKNISDDPIVKRTAGESQVVGGWPREALTTTIGTTGPDLGVGVNSHRPPLQQRGGGRPAVNGGARSGDRRTTETERAGRRQPDRTRLIEPRLHQNGRLGEPSLPTAIGRGAVPDGFGIPPSGGTRPYRRNGRNGRRARRPPHLVPRVIFGLRGIAYAFITKDRRRF